MNIKSDGFLRNRENRIYFFYKNYLLGITFENYKSELHENYFEYNFSKEQEKVIELFFKKRDEIEDVLLNILPKDWRVERINYLEKAVLINAILEIKFLNNKKAIVINESLNYAKKYCSLECPPFINSALDKL